MQTTRNRGAKNRKDSARPKRDECSVPQPLKAWTAQQTAVAVFLVALVAGCLYLPILRHPFINFDDPAYVTENAHVKEGLGWDSFVWAWTSLEDGNWHPVTWISHEADAQIFGMEPRGHHLTSLLLHSANSALLFLFLAAATRRAGCSLTVALFFAVQPLNVESVAWVAERKNLLSAFWSLISFIAYVRYSRSQQLRWLALNTGFFVMALASKPMAITLPFLFLVLDRWPLERVSSWQDLFANRKLWIEKAPLFALCVASAVITSIAQHQSGAIASLTQVPLPWRIENAVISYGFYAWKLISPFGLAFLYPWPVHAPPVWQAVSAALFVIVVTVAALKQRGQRPWLMASWLWFVGTLVPVIGLIQVGPQARADRYCYIPMIGLLIAAVWSGAEILRRAPSRFKLQPAAVIVVAGFLGVMSRKQMEYWRGNHELWMHAWDVTSDNYIAADKVGLALQSEGRSREALPYFEKALSINASDPLANFIVGADLHQRGRVKDALPFYEVTANQNTDPLLRADAFENLGVAYRQLGDLSAARESYARALQYDPQRTRIYTALHEMDSPAPAAN